MIDKEKIKENLNILKGDTAGGVIAAIVALPQALAFGVATGIGAIAGVWGAIILSFVSGIFGPNSPLISGPTGPCTIALATIIVQHHFDLSAVYIILLLAALIQLAISLTKASEIVKYVPYPVISGFMNGVGVILIVMQLNPLLGHDVMPTVNQTILSLPASLMNINPYALFLGILTLFICFVIPKSWSRYFPAQLAALIFATVVSIIFNMDVERISGISLELPSLHFPAIGIKTLMDYFPYALILAIVASSESLLTSLVADSLMKKQSNTQRIVLSQGLGNLCCALTGSLYGAAATMRTAAAIKNGATTRISTIISTCILLAILLKFGAMASQIPLAVLGGILVKIGYDIIDTKFLKVVKFAPRDDLYVLAVVFLLTVFYNLIFAVAAGIVLASLLYAKRVADRTNLGVKEVYDTEIMKIEKKLEKDYKHKIRVVHINGQFFFGSATQVVSQFDELLGTKYLILNYESDSPLDISAIFALEDIIIRLQSQRIKVLLVVHCEKVLEQLTNLKIREQIGEELVFCREEDAIEHAKMLLKTKIKNKSGLHFPFWHFHH